MRFTFVLPNLAGGGAEKAMVKLGRALIERGHSAEILLLEGRIEHALPQNLPVRALHERLQRGWLGKRFTAAKLARALSSWPDLVVSTLPFADEVASIAGLPRHWCRIANTLGCEIDRLAATPGKAFRRSRRYRRLYRDRPLIAVSEGVARDLEQRFGVRGPIEIIPNPFDFAAIRRAGTAEFPKPSTPYALHVGRFAPQKRHDLLLDAWARVETRHTLVLLTAPNPRLSAMITERGLAERVLVAGFQSNPYPWIAHADLLILCSDHEGLPNVLIEALALGTPAVSTDCPSGPREILGAFPQCLVPPNDAVALADAIQRTLASPPDVCRADLSRFEADCVAAAYERVASRA